MNTRTQHNTLTLRAAVPAILIGAVSASSGASTTSGESLRPGLDTRVWNATDIDHLLGDLAAAPPAYVPSTRDASSPTSDPASERRGARISFSALNDSPNLRTFGTDEVGRPYNIPATAPTPGVFEDLVFPLSRRSSGETKAQRRADERLSFAALESGLDIYELLSGADETTRPDNQSNDAAQRDGRVALNYNGREVHPATLPYFNDFESGERGEEWASRSNVSRIDTYSSFVGPLRRSEQVMHARVEPGQNYLLQFDLYLIGFAENIPADRTGMFTILVDGAPVIEQPFGTLRDQYRNVESDADDADTGNEGEYADQPMAPINGQILRDVRASFTPSSEIVEIVIQGDTGPGFGTGSWGFDNILIDEGPETNLGSFSSADFTGDSQFVGTTPIRLDGSIQPIKRNPAEPRTGRTRSFRQTPGQRNADFDLQDFLDDLLDDLLDEEDMDEDMDEDMMDEDEEDEDMMDDEEIPAPGPAALLFIGSGYAGLRRRR